MEWPNHGGQPATMKKLFQLEKEKQILDFSANLNPLGPPFWLKEELNKHVGKLTFYPDPTYSASSAYLANFEGVQEEELLLTNGGAEAIFLTAKYFEGKKAIIIHPAFMEYERACRHYHLEIEDVILNAEDDFKLPMNTLIEKLPKADVVFLCRPNNPTGTVVPKAEVRFLLEEGLKSHTYIVVDEAFVDFLPSASLTKLVADYPNLLLLRSLTKMYTIPGLRLGYMVGHKEVIKTLKEEQIPWSINALADSVVPMLLQDRNFAAHTMEWLKVQSVRMLESLTELDFYVSASQVNFYLLQDRKHPNQTQELFEYLFHHGILTRHTHNFKGLNGDFLRIAVRSEEENAQLLTVIRKWRTRA